VFDLTSFLRQDVVPALGCTEPGAVALAVARAREALEPGAEIDSVQVLVSDSVFKNGKDVGIPGVIGVRGNAVAAALGALAGRSDDRLELLRAATEADVARAVAMVRDGSVCIERLLDQDGVFVEACVISGDHEACAVIRDDHAHIAEVRLDGASISSSEMRSSDGADAEADVRTLSFEQIYRLPDDLTADQQEMLLVGVRMNRAIAEAGLHASLSGEPTFAEALATLRPDALSGGDLGHRIRIYAVAASEARMSGHTLPVMASSGSGNAGLVAVLPVSLVAESRAAGDRDLARALAVSHLITSYVKAHVGRLSPVCGCVVAAGSGAAAGICHLLGAPVVDAAEAIRLLLCNSAGLFCDGAKLSCALKVGTASHEAYLSAMMVIHGARLGGPQGVADVEVERTIENVARLNAEGLAGLDRVIISILEERACVADEPRAASQESR